MRRKNVVRMIMLPFKVRHAIEGGEPRESELTWLVSFETLDERE